MFFVINDPEHDASSPMAGEKKNILPMLAHGSPCSRQELASIFAGAWQEAGGRSKKSGPTSTFGSLAGVAAASFSGDQ
jgi:hypothetical protein